MPALRAPVCRGRECPPPAQPPAVQVRLRRCRLQRRAGGIASRPRWCAPFARWTSPADPARAQQPALRPVLSQARAAQNPRPQPGRGGRPRRRLTRKVALMSTAYGHFMRTRRPRLQACSAETTPCPAWPIAPQLERPASPQATGGSARATSPDAALRLALRSARSGYELVPDWCQRGDAALAPKAQNPRASRGFGSSGGPIRPSERRSDQTALSPSGLSGCLSLSLVARSGTRAAKAPSPESRSVERYASTSTIRVSARTPSCAIASAASWDCITV